MLEAPVREDGQGVGGVSMDFSARVRERRNLAQIGRAEVVAFLCMARWAQGHQGGATSTEMSTPR